MQHNPKASANALAVIGGAIYVICALWTLVARESFLGLMNMWVHGIDLGSVATKTPDFGTLVLGMITLVVAAWITGYAFAVVYNYFLQQK